MIRILASDGMDKSAIAALEAKGCEVVSQFYEPEDLKKELANYDVIVVRSATKVREPIIDAAVEAGRLKMIIRGGVGVDNIDVKYAESKGLIVKNTPRASSQSVAELAMGHMFACARFLSIAGYTMRNDKWEKKAYAKGIELQGKTLGIVGFGRIGQALGKMAKAIGMKVVAYDIFHIPGIEEELGIPYVEMDELLAQADFVSVHAPAVNGGALINEETIAKMKDGVVIINTSRGTNVDEDALLAALESGKVRAAGLDVWAVEPANNHALYSHPMVSCTPHIGATTVEAQKRIGAEIVDLVSCRGDYEALAARLRTAETIVLATPLYVDGLPSAVLRLLAALERDPGGKKRIYVIANLGFYESQQIRNLLAFVRNWCDGCGYTYAGGLAVGAGAMNAQLLKLPPAKNAVAGLERFASAILDKRCINDHYEDSFRFPRAAYVFAANRSWLPKGKKNGLTKEDLRRG